MASSFEDSLPENIALLKFSILDIYPFKNMLEALKGFRDTFTMCFLPSHIEIVAVSNGPNGEEKSKHKYVIYGDKILNYCYPCHEVDGKKIPKHPHISVEVQASNILALSRGKTRNDTLDFKIIIDLENSSCLNMFIESKVSSTSLPIPKCVTVTSCRLGPPVSSIDYYESYYSKRTHVTFPHRLDVEGTPNSRISTSAFCKFLSEAKSSGCTRFELSLTEFKHIDIYCFKGPTPSFGGTLPESGLDIELTQMFIPRKSIDCGDGFMIDESPYTISFGVKEVEWMEKMDKLAKMSVLEIFMDDGCPVVFRCSIGLYGNVTFTLSN